MRPKNEWAVYASSDEEMCVMLFDESVYDEMIRLRAEVARLEEDRTKCVCVQRPNGYDVRGLLEVD